MKAMITRNNNLVFATAHRNNNHFLYISLTIVLIFLGIISLEIITLNHSALIILGLASIAIALILAISDLFKFLLLFTLYLPFSRILPGDFATGFWALNLTNILTIVLIISIIVKKLNSNINIIPKSSISIPILLFCLLGMASFVKSASYFGYIYFNQFLSSFKEWLSPIFLFFLFLVSLKDKEDIKRLVMLIIFITICVSVLVVFEYLRVRGAEDFDKMRVGAIFDQPNRAGAFFVYYIFILVAFFLINIHSSKYWFLMIPILISARALMYTYSRGAIIAFVGASLFITFIKNKLLFLVLIFFIFFAIINPAILPSSIYKRFSSTFIEDEIYPDNAELNLEVSAKNRITIWKGAIEMIKEHPIFGIGYGVFPYLISFYVPVNKMDAHNTYLSIAAELGIPALVLFLLILIIILKNSWFVYKKTKDKFIKAFALGLSTGIIGLLMCNIFGSRLDSQELTGLFWILVASVFKSKELIKKGKLA